MITCPYASGVPGVEVPAGVLQAFDTLQASVDAAGAFRDLGCAPFYTPFCKGITVALFLNLGTTLPEEQEAAIVAYSADRHGCLDFSYGAYMQYGVDAGGKILCVLVIKRDDVVKAQEDFADATVADVLRCRSAFMEFYKEWQMEGWLPIVQRRIQSPDFQDLPEVTQKAYTHVHDTLTRDGSFEHRMLDAEHTHSVYNKWAADARAPKQ